MSSDTTKDLAAARAARWSLLFARHEMERAMEDVQAVVARLESAPTAVEPPKKDKWLCAECGETVEWEREGVVIRRAVAGAGVCETRVHLRCHKPDPGPEWERFGAAVDALVRWIEPDYGNATRVAMELMPAVRAADPRKKEEAPKPCPTCGKEG